MSAKAKVAVLYTKAETVLDDYRRLFVLADARQHLDPTKPTILKDNITWHYPMPGCNTTPWQLEGTILGLGDIGLRDLAVVQNRTVVVDTEKGEDLNRYVPIFRKCGLPVLYNFRPEDMSWIVYRPKAKMLALDRVFPKGIKIPDYFIGKNIVHMPTMKCHIYTTTTGAMKNAFGGLLSTNRHYTHTWIHETLVDLLAIQKEIHPGIFAVMDGTTAGNGPGPRTIEPVVKNVIMASADQVAIDAIAAKMMGFEPMSIKYIRLAHEAGLGKGDPAEIEVVGDDVRDVNWGFRVGYNFHRFLGWLSWYGPTRVLQKIVTRKPVVYIPILVSATNHDLIFWPFKGRRLYKQWLANTGWGRLFQEYERRGCLLR